MMRVASTKPLGDEFLDLLSEELGPLEAEELLHLGVDQLDDAVTIDDHDGIRGGLEETSEHRLRALAIRDVPDRAHDEEPAPRLERAQADLDGELGAVPAEAEQLEARSHAADLRVRDVAGAMRGMPGAEALGDEDLNRQPPQIGEGVAEQLLRLSVDDHDASFRVGDDHRVRRRLEQAPKV